MYSQSQALHAYDKLNISHEKSAKFNIPSKQVLSTTTTSTIQQQQLFFIWDYATASNVPTTASSTATTTNGNENGNEPCSCSAVVNGQQRPSLPSPTAATTTT